MDPYHISKVRQKIWKLSDLITRGASIGAKSGGMARKFFKTIDDLSKKSKHDKMDRFMKVLRSLETDSSGGSEVNIQVDLMEFNEMIYYLARSEIEARVVHAFNVNKSPSILQFGGMFMAAFDLLATRMDILDHDLSRLGRWASMAPKGK